jgi:hypothetical protein
MERVSHGNWQQLKEYCGSLAGDLIVVNVIPAVGEHTD